MGCFGGDDNVKPVSTNSGRQATEKINKKLAAQRSAEARIFKILLLGTGASGKSTILKQMKLVSGYSFSPGEIDESKQDIRELILASILVVAKELLFNQLGAMDIGLQNALANDLDEPIRIILSYKTELPPVGKMTALGEAISTLWTNTSVQKFWLERNHDGMIPDSSSHFLDKADVCFGQAYEPDVADVLRARKATVGVTLTDFNEKGAHLRVVDVGGQRALRGRWAGLFADVKVIMFVISLADYNLVLEEDKSTNRLHEALNVYKSIIRKDIFKNTIFFLLFNKDDIFREKIQTIDMNHFHSDYTGGCEYEPAVGYIKDLFLKCPEATNRRVLQHTTTALDQDIVAKAWKAITQKVLGDILQKGGMLS